jgi:hypothetical protein
MSVWWGPGFASEAWIPSPAFQSSGVLDFGQGLTPPDHQV